MSPLVSFQKSHFTYIGKVRSLEDNATADGECSFNISIFRHSWKGKEPTVDTGKIGGLK